MDVNDSPYLRKRPGINSSRVLARSISERESIAIQLAILGIVPCFAYKLEAVCLLLLAFLISRVHKISLAPFYTVYPACFGLAYIALATTTAVFVSVSAGLIRTAQFGIVAVGSLVMVAHLASLDKTKLERFFRWFSITSSIVIAHLVIYHVSNGHLTTWKYLYDTKMYISLMIVLLFYFEDEIRKWSVLAWVSLFSVCAGMVLASGERKAYLLFALVALISRSSAKAKVFVCLCAAALGFLWIAAASSDSYVARQLMSLTQKDDEIPTRYFFSVSSIAHHSDMIREFVNRNAMRLFKENPIMGVGSTGYSAWATKTYGSIKTSGGLSMNVHGEMHRVPAESGLIGIFVALTYLLMVFIYCLRYIFQNGGALSSSKIRAPLYVFLFLISYIYSEALDTAMLTLIMCTGLMASCLPLNTAPPRGQPLRYKRIGSEIRKDRSASTKEYGILRKRPYADRLKKNF